MEKRKTDMGRRKIGRDEGAEGYRTCPDNWRFFLRTALYAGGLAALGGLLLFIAVRLYLPVLAFAAYLLWGIVASLAGLISLGLYLDTVNRRTLRSLRKGEDHHDNLYHYHTIVKQSKPKEK